MTADAQLDLGLGAAARRRDHRAPGRRPAGRAAAATVPARPSALVGSRGPTLDAVLVGTWARLRSGGPVDCPVCRGGMVARFGAGPSPVGARCVDCRAELA